MAKIEIDRTRCTGLGVCESLAERYFEINDDGELVLPAGEEVTGSDLDEVRVAVAGCPTEALFLRED